MTEKLSKKTYVVTGVTSGIGYSIAGQLVERGAHVIGIGRSAEKCQQTRDALQSLAPDAQVECLTADLSLQSAVRDVARDISQVVHGNGNAGIDALINNAGTFQYWLTLTPEGFETQWAVNHLAPFLLTHELLPLLKQSEGARVITVSSGSHYNTHLRWDDIQLIRGYNGLLAYKQTKLANVLFSSEFNRHMDMNANVTAYAADPGLVDTDIGAKSNSLISRWVWRFRRRGGIPPEESARGIVFLATEEDLPDDHAVYWKHGQPQNPSHYAQDPHPAGRLWLISEKMCAITRGDYGQ